MLQKISPRPSLLKRVIPIFCKGREGFGGWCSYNYGLMNELTQNPLPCGDGEGILSNKTIPFFLDNRIARMIVLYVKPWFYMDSLEGGQKKRSEERYLVPAVEQASRVLSACWHRASHMSLIEICAQVGIHKSKAFSILETLQRFGLVQRNTDGKDMLLARARLALTEGSDNLSPPRLASPSWKRWQENQTAPQFWIDHRQICVYRCQARGRG